ncbi:hypothetical protein N7510_007690 [Penicillium lagena]|uniref:uncharacterized protein n=1 Tax=Penicillium lagena TaxID=94218 RepID=UPI00253FDAF3|nr:uncharacterized protein N7510_007690 [Penicillium lagena]KAJ5610971.1 hypothetical protein N7510_007690 [Penicillium lagena]
MPCQCPSVQIEAWIRGKCGPVDSKIRCYGLPRWGQADARGDGSNAKKLKMLHLPEAWYERLCVAQFAPEEKKVKCSSVSPCFMGESEMCNAVC